MKHTRKLLTRYLITAAIAGAVTLLTLYLHGFWEETSIVEKYRLLADAFTIPGVILVMLTALVWISSEGMFDGLVYAFKRIGSSLIPFYGGAIKHQTYYDYKESKDGDRPQGYSFLFFVGLAFVLVAVVFVFLHASVEG